MDLSVASLVRTGIYGAVGLSLLVAWLAYDAGSPLWLVFVQSYACLLTLSALLAVMYRATAGLMGELEAEPESPTAKRS